MGCPHTAGDPRPIDSATLIGRDTEIRTMIELLDAMSPGRPCVLAVEGPPGSGRTRLLDEFAAIARRRGVTVVREPEWTGAAGIRRIPLLHRCRPGVEAFLFVCDRPHLVDPRIWSALDLLADSTPVLVAMTAEQLVPPAAHRIRLDPLSPGDVRTMIARLLGAPPGADLLDLSRVAAGRPGAVHDLVTGLREEGLLRTVAGRAGLTGVRLPERTRARLAGRLAAMSPPARHLLQAATMLRSPFPLVRLTRLLRVSPVVLLPAIDEVLECGLLTGDNEMLSFSHELVRSVVESSMPRSVLAALRDESARLHRRPVANRPPQRRAVDWSVLTAREQEIAELAGRAMTNRQIATRVGRSPHTVNYHLRQIFRKLDITSRVELASLMRQREAAGLPAGDPSSSGPHSTAPRSPAPSGDPAG